MDIIWPGCDELVASATRQFLSLSRSYSTQSSRFSIYSLFNQLIDPAWKDYLFRLSENRPDELNLEANIGELAHKKSFWFLENKFREWLRLSHNSQKIGSDFPATLDTLIDLTMFCRVKAPRRSRKTSGDRLNWGRLRKRKIKHAKHANESRRLYLSCLKQCRTDFSDNLCG